MPDIIGGLHPVSEALKARADAFERIYIARGPLRPALKALLDQVRTQKIKVDRVDRPRLDRLYGGQAHQGVVALVGPYSYLPFDEAQDKIQGSQTLVLVLDGIQDPMNLGGLLRSAETAGVRLVILPRERAAPVSQTVIKASAGAAEHLNICRVVNLTRSIEWLKDQGFWVAGLDHRAEACLYDQDLAPKTALVIGGEGSGIRRLVKESCDLLVSIPLRGRVSSLNAAAAGAVAMFEYVRQTRTGRQS